MSTVVSTTPSIAAAATTTTTKATTSNYLSNIGLGYSISIALGVLVLIAIVLLASYICCRSFRRRSNNPIHTITNDGGINLPRVIFIAEDDEQSGDGDEPHVTGLHQSVINSYPRFQFSKESACNGGSCGSNTTCSICLCDYKNTEMLRMMPECRHYFHLCCLDAWLNLNGSCPVCRNSPLPTPLSTPLSEVVPLSQYAADRTRTSR